MDPTSAPQDLNGWLSSGASFREHVIPSDVGYVHQVQRGILEHLTAAGYTEREVFAIKLAVEEAVMNAIFHGNQADARKKVRVAYHVSQNAFFIRVQDEGGGFDPAAVPDPTRAENLEKPSGRGLLLMRYYMSEVQFLDRGTTVVMCKRRQASS